MVFGHAIDWDGVAAGGPTIPGLGARRDSNIVAAVNNFPGLMRRRERRLRRRRGLKLRRNSGGTYNVTVTATLGNTKQSQVLKLVVQ